MFVFLPLCSRCSLFLPGANFLWDTWCKIFSFRLCMAYIFIFLRVPFTEQKFSKNFILLWFILRYMTHFKFKKQSFVFVIPIDMDLFLFHTQCTDRNVCTVGALSIGKSGHICLILYLSEQGLVFHHWEVNYFCRHTHTYIFHTFLYF